MANTASTLAAISIILYASLASTSFYFYYRMCTVRERTNILGLGQFNYSKKVFFLVLGVSAALDIPLYIGCASRHGPVECEWNTMTYSFCWACHLVALVGYTISIGIPLFLWSDIYHGRDGNLFSTKYPDFTKFFLHLSIISFFLVQLTTILALLVLNSKNPAEFDKNPVRALATFLEPFLILLISAVWLWNGIRLQIYVVNVCFRPAYERKILLTINIVMFTVLCSYLLRAVMVLSLFTDWLHDRSLHPINESYIGWMFGTRWIPYILCSYLLIFIMRRSTTPEDSIDSTEQLLVSETTNSDSTTGFTKSSKSSTPGLLGGGSATKAQYWSGSRSTRMDHSTDHSKLSSDPGSRSESDPGSRSFGSGLSGVDEYDNQYRVQSAEGGMYFASSHNHALTHEEMLKADALAIAAIAASHLENTNTHTGGASLTHSPPGSTSSSRAPLLQNSEHISSLLL